MSHWVQRLLALVMLIVLSPLLAVLALLVRISSSGPALHRATRWRPGGPFTLHKFRTMREGAAGSGPAITAEGDPRVTGIGRLLRRTKLDELPQLWDVVRGKMLLVGPRPEDPSYVDFADPVHRTVFGTLPGITGAAALAYRNEESILAEAARALAAAEGRQALTIADTERAYRTEILPRKLALEVAYLETRSARGDLGILARTIGQVLRRTTPR